MSIMINDINEMISFIQGLKRSEKKVSLDRFRAISEVYGSPHLGFKYIHVGGTNGKGSVVSYLKNILIDAGYRVGSYVSPYVICFNERISLNDNYISNEDILEIGNYIIDKFPLLNQKNLRQPTFFEFVTLLAFLYFKKQKPDCVIMEVGIGGLLDCTNIIDPIISVISNVAYDHMNVLGDTLEEIALNKVGILKENKALITLENEEVNHIFINEAKRKNAKLLLVKKSDIKNVLLDYRGLEFYYKDYHINSKMKGLYQAENIAISIEAINEFIDRTGAVVTKENILNGISKTYWPGRFEVVSKEPLIIVDGAHNIDGITRLCETIKVIKGEKKLTVVFAVSKDKAKDKMIEALSEVSDEMIFSSFDYKRSDDPKVLIELAKSFNNKRIINDLDNYLDEIRKSKEDRIYLFCGSLYFVSELLPKFKNEKFR